MTVGHVSAPFLDFKSFITEKADAEEQELRPTPAASAAVFFGLRIEDGESVVDNPLREAYSALVNEFHDEEFDEALFELLTDARNICIRIIWPPVILGAKPIDLSRNVFPS